jgi:hypothetical protein
MFETIGPVDDEYHELSHGEASAEYHELSHGEASASAASSSLPPPPVLGHGGGGANVDLAPNENLDDPPFGYELPAWASFEFDAKAWHSVLTSYGVDQAAQHVLFLLATCDGENGGGKRKANGLIRKLIYKMHDNSITNPSGFIMSGAHKARVEICGEEFAWVPEPATGRQRKKQRHGGR